MYENKTITWVFYVFQYVCWNMYESRPVNTKGLDAVGRSWHFLFIHSSRAFIRRHVVALDAMMPTSTRDDDERRARAYACVVASNEGSDGREEEDGSMGDGLKPTRARASSATINAAIEGCGRRRGTSGTRSVAHAFDGVEETGSPDAWATACARAATAATERGDDFAAFWLRGDDGGGKSDWTMKVVRESRVVERVVEGMRGLVRGLEEGTWELSATCVGARASERGGEPRDLLDDGADEEEEEEENEDENGARGMTVALVECARDGTVALESAAARAEEAFRDGGAAAAGASAAAHHVVFTLRLKLWRDDASSNEPTISRVHFVFVAPYVPTPGVFANHDNRAARVECTKSTTAMMSVLRGLNRRSANGTPVRQVKVWGESPLTRLMWASGMADLRRANLYVLCENVMCRSVEGDETSPLALPPGTEGALRFALQLKEPLDDDEPAPRTRNPPTPTATTSSRERDRIKPLRPESTRARPARRAPPSRDPHASSTAPASAQVERKESSQSVGPAVSITQDQVEAVIRIIRANAHGLNGRRLESTVRNLMTEWTRMADAHESILDQLTALEHELVAAQEREDEAASYAEKIAADLAVTSRWCETLEAEQSSVGVRIEKAALDAAREPETRANELERRVKELELELLRNSVPEMERVRDEAERASRDAVERLREEREKYEGTRRALEAEVNAKRELMEQIASMRRRAEDAERARETDRDELARAREELQERHRVEGETRDRISRAAREHDEAMKTAREAKHEWEDKLNVMRRDRDDALHKLRLKEEEVVEAHAAARAAALNVEALQTATNDVKQSQHASNKELEDLKLVNSDLLVQVKHAERELEETALALRKLEEKLERLEEESATDAKRRLESDDETHRLGRVIADLEMRVKSVEMDREIAYQAADVARVENAKVSARVLEMTDENARLASALAAARESNRALLDEESARLQRLAPASMDAEYVSPAWLHDDSWQHDRTVSLAS